MRQANSSYAQAPFQPLRRTVQLITDRESGHNGMCRRFVWAAAREAVKFATTISFVGLSMHRYMEQGLKFLFQAKKRIRERDNCK